jgi:phospholipid/cholesterol/gamma-HCH transport system substrate-binding protein
MTANSPVKNRLVRLTSVAVIVALAAATGLWWLYRDHDKHITALFGTGVGVYPGSEVRILGVQIGTVTDAHPEGALVRVTMDLGGDVRVPSGAQALVVTPSLVADRYVQLSPVYRGGPELADAAVIPRERTATPVELDQLFSSINDLTTALGPKGANADGALSRLLDVGAANLKDNGQAINDTITKIGRLTATLSANKGDLFATVDNLRKFISTLAASDQQVHGLSQKLSDVTGFLAGEKDDLAGALSELATALEQVRGFIADNRGAIKSNVDKLAGVTKVLADQRSSLAEILDVAPTALNNFVNGYDAASGSLQIRANLNELSTPPIVTVCNLVRQGTPTPLPQTLAEACDKLAPVLNGLVPLPSGADLIAGAQTGNLPLLPLVSALGGHR